MVLPGNILMREDEDDISEAEPSFGTGEKHPETCVDLRAKHDKDSEALC